jgi:hypothetical protein
VRGAITAPDNFSATLLSQRLRDERAPFCNRFSRADKLEFEGAPKLCTQGP